MKRINEKKHYESDTELQYLNVEYNQDEKQSLLNEFYYKQFCNNIGQMKNIKKAIDKRNSLPIRNTHKLYDLPEYEQIYPLDNMNNMNNMNNNYYNVSSCNNIYKKVFFNFKRKKSDNKEKEEEEEVANIKINDFNNDQGENKNKTEFNLVNNHEINTDQNDNNHVYDNQNNDESKNSNHDHILENNQGNDITNSVALTTVEDICEKGNQTLNNNLEIKKEESSFSKQSNK